MTHPQGIRDRPSIRSLTRNRHATENRIAPGTIRRIVGFGRPYRVDIGIHLGLVLLGAVAGATQPLLFRAIIDDGIMQDRSGLVIALGTAIAGLALVASVIGLVQRYFTARIGQGIVHDLRTKVFEHVQQQPIAFFSRTQTGVLVSRLNSDVQGAQQAFTSMLSTVVANVINTTIVVGVMLALSAPITMVALLMAPFFIVPARFAGRKLASLTRERYDLIAKMGQTMTERFSVAGAMLIKAFARDKAEAAEFSKHAGQVRDIGITTAVYSRILSSSLALLAGLAVAVVYVVGGLMAIGSSLGVGTVVALTAYLGRLYGPIMSLSNLQVDVMTALVSFERVFEVLDLEPTVADGPCSQPLRNDAASVEFNQVDFRYPAPSRVSLASLETGTRLSDAANEQIFNGMTFTVEPGQMIALVGPSGAGKTTVLKLILRLYDVGGGAVRIGGADVRDVTQSSLREAIGAVMQESHLFHTTLRANLAYAKPNATEVEMWDALAIAQAASLISSLPAGLDTVVGDRGYRLSAGEKQRIAIARLLLRAPRIALLDEATAHLDCQSELAVQKALAEALAGRTVIVIAHRLATVRKADRILVIDNGRVVQSGRHEELLAAGGTYGDLYQTQFETHSPFPVPARGALKTRSAFDK